MLTGRHAQKLATILETEFILILDQGIKRISATAEGDRRIGCAIGVIQYEWLIAWVEAGWNLHLCWEWHDGGLGLGAVSQKALSQMELYEYIL